MGLAEGHAALGAAGGLGFGLLGDELAVDFVKIARALGSRALFGPSLPDGHEFLHAFGHERAPNHTKSGNLFLYAEIHARFKQKPACHGRFGLIFALSPKGDARHGRAGTF
jgi:hypothetical protein